jgi:FKBP-type peptidyl-prolyl cis-trans isomerase FklB
MMNVGAKWKVFLPANLAWGEDGLGDIVGPHAVIIFDLELIESKPTNK